MGEASPSEISTLFVSQLFVTKMESLDLGRGWKTGFKPPQNWGTGCHGCTAIFGGLSQDHSELWIAYIAWKSNYWMIHIVFTLSICFQRFTQFRRSSGCRALLADSLSFPTFCGPSGWTSDQRKIPDLLACWRWGMLRVTARRLARRVGAKPAVGSVGSANVPAPAADEWQEAPTNHLAWRDPQNGTIMENMDMEMLVRWWSASSSLGLQIWWTKMNKEASSSEASSVHTNPAGAWLCIGQVLLVEQKDQRGNQLAFGLFYVRYCPELSRLFRECMRCMSISLNFQEIPVFFDSDVPRPHLWALQSLARIHGSRCQPDFHFGSKSLVQYNKKLVH